MTLWEKFNGNKTIFGLVLLQGADAIPDPQIALIVSTIGALLAGLGAAHRVVKVVKSEEP